MFERHDTPTSAPVDAARPTPTADELLTRLERRLQALEKDPSVSGIAPRIPQPEGAEEEPHLDPVEGVKSLNRQLEVLREQLEAAFNEMEDRITASERRAAAAEKAAEQADQRAQVASARAANVLAAVDSLASELGRLVHEMDPDSSIRLRGAVDRLRTRLQTTT